MNQRQKKKVKKRLGCKTYYGYRNKLLHQIARQMIAKHQEEMKQNGTPINPNLMNILHVVDSKRRDLKHIHSLRVFYGCYPKSISTSNDGETKSVDKVGITLNF